jgi:hypothetical protein
VLFFIPTRFFSASVETNTLKKTLISPFACPLRFDITRDKEQNIGSPLSSEADDESFL